MSHELLQRAHKLQPQLIEDRRHLHEHPELSFQEVETAAFAEKRLSSLGYKIRSKLARTGLIGDIGAGKKHCVAIRADMDGLPIQEPDTNSYHSKNQNVMHACGHDAHVSCLLGAAKLLAEDVGKDVDPYDGRLRMLLQPAEETFDEEGYSGAPRMLQDGALEGVSSIIGLHVDATLPIGKIGVSPGAVMAGVDTFEIRVDGKGGHGAFPDQAIDPVVIAAQIILAVQTIISRRVPATDAAVITLGSIHSDSTRGNIIPDSVKVLGTARSLSDATRRILHDELENVVKLAEAMGGKARVNFHHGYPITTNDASIAEIMKNAAGDIVGAENVIELPPKLWSEDFSFYQKQVPGCFIFVGTGIANSPRTHHTPGFDIDESCLYLGTAILAESAKRIVKHLASAS